MQDDGREGQEVRPGEPQARLVEPQGMVQEGADGMRYCATCGRFVDRLKACLGAGHEIYWEKKLQDGML